MWRLEIFHRDTGEVLGDKLIPTRYLYRALGAFRKNCSWIITRVKE